MEDIIKDEIIKNPYAKEAIEIKPEVKMIRSMNTSESISNIAQALAKAQGEMEAPKNIANNPFFKSKYAPLSEILNVAKPALAKYEIALLQSPQILDNGSVSVITTLMHSSGEFIESSAITSRPEKANVQGVGSTITYLKRYSIAAMLNLSSEDDDDGNGASPSNSPKEKVSQKPSISPELKKAIEEVDTIAKEKAKIDKKAVTEAIKNNHSTKGSANYNTIQDVEHANKVLEALKLIK